MSQMIRLQQVTKRYENTVAVEQLSLEVNQGEVSVLIGPSGCGKTTTLRMINRLIEPTAGHIFVNGKDISTIRPEELRRSMGYAIQNVGLFPHMTVAANIAVVPELLHWNKSLIQSRIEELLVLVGLNPAEYALKYPYQLSGGEAQRIGVARALAADPPILLMDEPFGAVDPLTRGKLQTQFLHIQQELRKTIILVTHDLDEAIRLADRVVVMESGRLVQYDTPEIILSKPVNKFVHDFVGVDRALKRLSRISVKGFIRQAPTINVDKPTTEADDACKDCRWLWVIDDSQRLVGWVDSVDLSRTSSIRETMIQADSEQIAVTHMATLRETLSRMLEQGFKTIPVVDDEGRFLGQVTLGDIEAATEVQN